MEQLFVGIDVAKDRLDVYLCSVGHDDRRPGRALERLGLSLAKTSSGGHGVIFAL